MKVKSIFNGVLVTPENSEEKQIVREHKKEIEKELSMYFENLIKQEGGKKR
ncbi:hypothetical protein QVA60_01510 [Staphylococcus chromogenes]|uniref:hypothetical protein n=1 Tax=Staphylococcus chromogenes TaxID=46126 RepID=UPI0028FDF33E|nr:hypothetical protein [Staphylococcus chromogenes]MDU0429162.1 hypothetical protein [Staphylococcus chromogenes]